ncbi:nucleic acid/nucleotide deaminase domain-containing protein [Actinomadura atramentaria]|uniref:nucleic acid/nucleotide deaminase domain-containing protein n=1 Tax=Actinomadura atramentaria TaxID=1990 RepID=UPI00036FA989|nr:nucleic acid/nucleotide deaminase domain-containing protein [Actinomadura atramentaria]
MGHTKGRSHVAGQASRGVFPKMAGELFRIGKGKKVTGLDPSKLKKEIRDEWSGRRKGKIKGRNSVNSKKIDPHDPNLNARDRELVDAIRDARKQLGNDKPGSNFAAIRYIDGNGEERILVTHNRGMHSERYGANYLLDDGVPNGNIKDVLSERSPCILSPCCDGWLGEHTSGANVKHIVDYQIGDNAGKNHRANTQMRHWTRSIFG